MKKLIKSVVRKLPYLGALTKRIDAQGCYPVGHYHSPVPDAADIAKYIATRGAPPPDLPDIDLHPERHSAILQEYLMLYDDLPFPVEQSNDWRYYYDNPWFGRGDAVFLYSFLRKHQPARIIEVGSGFSSAVMLDTVDEFLDNKPDITFIEPNPERLLGLLNDQDRKNVTLLDTEVQNAPLQIFQDLRAGDLLFIDSSHVVKTGSDLTRLLFDVMPLLESGVFVHFHDVFYPFDYPGDWLAQGRYWNENYFLRAFLANNDSWSVYFFNDYVALKFKEFIAKNMPLCAVNSGGSLYLLKH